MPKTNANSVPAPLAAPRRSLRQVAPKNGRGALAESNVHETATVVAPPEATRATAARRQSAATHKLTDRQQEILELIQRRIASGAAPPTRAEIAQALGFRSANAAEDHLQALARKGVIELIGGTSRGIRLRTTGASTVMSHQSSLPLPALAQLCLPLVGRVAAGHPILAQQHIDRTYAVEPHLFSELPDYLLAVRGMSMCNVGIIDGDLLAVRKCATARDGQIVVARIGDEVTVKRLRCKDGLIELVPENDAFDPIRISADDESFALEGVAVGLIRGRM